MHTLGKVFLGLNVVLVIAAMLFMAKLINVRNSWMQQVEQKADQIDKNDLQIADKERQAAQLRSDLVRQRLAWDTMRLAPNSRADAEGVVTAGVGPNDGFGIAAEGQPLPIVHVFAPKQGKPVYIGPFQVAAARGGQSQLQPLFRVFADEPATWEPGTWRLWHVVPSQAPSRVVELTSDVVTKSEAAMSRQATLALQQKAVEQAQEALEGRRKELLGDPQAPKIEEAPEIQAGLVAALRDAESARNADLAELDRLRREVDEAYERLTQLVAENGQLVRQMGSGPALSSAR